MHVCTQAAARRCINMACVPVRAFIFGCERVFCTCVCMRVGLCSRRNPRTFCKFYLYPTLHKWVGVLRAPLWSHRFVPSVHLRAKRRAIELYLAIIVHELLIGEIIFSYLNICLLSCQKIRSATSHSKGVDCFSFRDTFCPQNGRRFWSPPFLLS